jgi:hypothetical protein
MNRIITTHVIYRGSTIPVESLKTQSQLRVEVECSHGRRFIRWCRRNQLCKQCAVEAGVFNTSPKGREITWGNKISKAKVGVKFSKQHKRALSVAQYGVAEEDWPGFYVKGPVHKLRDSVEYVEFRKSIMLRDNYTCQLTGMRGKLNVHHIEAISSSLEKALDPDNVITLHASIHKLFHDIYGRGHNTREQFNEFLLKIREEVIYG